MHRLHRLTGAPVVALFAERLPRGADPSLHTKLGRGAVVILDVPAPEDVHKIVNQWNELIPATFEVEALLPGEHQEKIARAGTNPMKL